MGYQIELEDGSVVEVELTGRYRDRRKAIAAYRRAYGYSPEVSAAKAGVGVEELLNWELMGDEEYVYWFLQGFRHHWVNSAVKALRKLVGLLDSENEAIVLQGSKALLNMFGTVYPKVLGHTLLGSGSSGEEVKGLADLMSRLGDGSGDS